MDRQNLILYLGADWRGSDARALGMGLRNLGHSLIEVNYEDYFPQIWSGLALKASRRILRGACTAEFDRCVAAHSVNTAIDFVLVFKGMLVEPETLHCFRRKSVPLYCFYPDVSFTAHGSNIGKCLPLYDCVFTTKRFHSSSGQIRHLQFVSHGFDPEVHRPRQISDKLRSYYECDVSFVGCWSPKKEATIQALLSDLAHIKMRIWGGGWERTNSTVRKAWQGRGAFGDELAIVYQCSKINLGLLSEAASDTSSGDQVTARTWQIPASGGFLLHEATAELAEYFVPGQEVATFDELADLTGKVEYFLRHDTERIGIAEAGHQRCLENNYTYGAAAVAICSYHSSQRKLSSR